uniref:TRF2/HOY1 PH-like domain-containing protein n=1 Tax=Noccaea caerulescens TaxID=107243 RepID=A0A1J3CPB9_NOCCA
MVEMMKSRNIRPETEPASKFPVKLEIVEDFLEEEDGPLNKRSKLWSNGTNVSLMLPTKLNLLEEPSPLGLSLRKSPSLQDLIQRRLSQSVAVGSGVKKESIGFASSLVGTVEKLKASNFPATILKIGQWEYKSRYEGDLVAKCYFAKHKLVWEVLEQGLKSKIEIQWSDIMSLKANFPEDEPGTLTVSLARRPLFFRETNPQPRKHTLWQATSDFTDGQASTNRQHVLQCPPGILNKHIEKLLQCDHRLFCLSQQPEMNLDSPLFFDTRQSIFEDPSSVSGSQNIASSPVGAQSSTSEHMSLSHDAALSPSSVMDARAIEGAGASVDSRVTTEWSQVQVPGLRQSISMNDFLALLSDPASGDNPELEEMKQLLLSDNNTQPETTSDEKSVMSKVNSFYNLLQAAANDDLDIGEVDINNRPKTECNDRVVDPASSSKPQGMSRKDSFSDLLVHLPRITSLPKFLFNISE